MTVARAGGNVQTVPGVNITSPSMQSIYSNALERWLASQNESRQLYGQAAQPLQESVQMFRPGGGYGAGQIAILEDEARRARAEALSNQVASGMSSGSLAASTGLRVGSDLAKAKLGVEDTRTQFLNQALQALSGLRGQQAGQAGSVYDPYTSTYMGAILQERGLDQALIEAVQNASLTRKSLNNQQLQPTSTTSTSRPIDKTLRL